MKSKLSGDNVNLATVTRELLDLIMKLPGKERAALLKKIKPSTQSAYDGKNTSAITTELIDCVMKGTIEKRCEVLGDLKALDGSSKRKYSRVEYFAPIHFILQGRMFQGYIRNISTSGIFIEVTLPGGQDLYKGEPVTLNFEHPDTRKHLKIGGQITRITKTGVGVKFYEPI